jgi:hypothetical protein
VPSASLAVAVTFVGLLAMICAPLLGAVSATIGAAPAEVAIVIGIACEVATSTSLLSRTSAKSVYESAAWLNVVRSA